MNNKGFLKKILTAYLCVMLIPFAFSFIANEYAISKSNEKMMSVLENTINDDAQGISQALTRVESNAQSISLNPELSRFFYKGVRKENPSVSEMMVFSRTLASYIFEDELIEDIFVYSKERKMLVSEQNSYNDAQVYFENLYCVDGEKAKDTLKRIENDTNRYSIRQRKKGDASYPVVEFIQNVPLTYDSSNGKVVVIISAKKLFEKLEEFAYSGGGQFKVYFKDSVIYESGKEVRNGYEFIAEPRYGQFVYEVELPKGFVRKENKVLSYILWGMNIVALIVGAIICLYFTMKKVKAYESIILKMELWGNDFSYDSKDEIETIDNFLSELQKSSRESEQEFLENQRIGSVYGVVHKLLMGFYSTHNEAEKDVLENGLVFNGDKYVVMLLSFDKGLNKSIDNVNIEDFIREVVMENIGEMIYIFRVDFRSMAVILSADTDDEGFETYLKNCISLLRIELGYKYDIDLHIGVGNVVEKLNEISDSMVGAREVISYCKLSGEEEISFSKDIPQTDAGFEYTDDVISDIVKNVVDGNVEIAVKALQTVKKEVFSGELPTVKTLVNLRKYLEKIMLEINRQTGNQSEFIFGRKSIPKMFEYVEEYMQTIPTENEKTPAGRNNALHAAIVDYVNENFSSATISLEELSAQFGLNPTYISTLFRKKTGDTFLRYVEKLRIKRACEYIDTSEYKIIDIAQKVGYVDYATFRRNFKKIVGVTPSEYGKKER